MLGLNLENTTSEDFRVTLTGRYLAYDIIGSGSELRVDGTLGSDPGLAMALHKPLGATSLFVAPSAGIFSRAFNVIQDDSVVASYGQTLSRAGLDVGMNLGRVSDLRLGAYAGRLTAHVDVGDPGLPAVEGKQMVTELKWRYDSQDSPVIPSRGVFAYSNPSHVFDGPDIDPPLESGRTSEDLTQLRGEASSFWRVHDRGRLFVLAGGGTSFGDRPLPTDQFSLGSPFHLGALDNGEVRGDHCYVTEATQRLGTSSWAGALHERVARHRERVRQQRERGHASTSLRRDGCWSAVIFETGFDGAWRTYIGMAASSERSTGIGGGAGTVGRDQPAAHHGRNIRAVG